jgi:Cof subfamily protein (haloacid dehalogenase superfamily)
MTVPTDIQLLISDIDGTLVTKDKVLTPAAVAAVQGLAAAGIAFTLTSARPPSGMRMLIDPLGLRLPLAGFNGGLIVDTDFNVIESHPIDPKAAAEGARLMQEGGLDLWVYTQDEWIVTDPDGFHVKREAWIIKMDPIARACTPADFANAFKIVGVSKDPTKIAAAQGLVSSKLGDTVSSSSSEPQFVDITHPNANKGAVVHALSRSLDLPTSRIATIGDMANDVMMFAQSGFSIAMGNASDAVKARATVVTDSNEQDGFASAVRRFLLATEAQQPA